MANIPGTILAAMVSPGDTTATFATHEDIYGKGGLMTFAYLSSLSSISVDRQKVGMLVYINETGEYYKVNSTGSPLTDYSIFDVGGGGGTNDTEVRQLSANWESTYVSVSSLSANWNSAYSFVTSNSANLTVTGTVSAKYFQGTLIDWMTLVRGYKTTPTLLATIGTGEVYTYVYATTASDKTYYRYIATNGSEDSFYGNFTNPTLSNLVATKAIIL